MEKAAVFTVIFPGNLKYFDAFLRSLTRQRHGSFDLLLVVDGVNDIDAHLEKYGDALHVAIRHCSGTIASIREDAVRWIKSLDYDYIVFADSDDVMHEDRVGVCVRALRQHAVVVNDVVPFQDTVNDTREGYWCQRMFSGKVFGREDIQYFNFAGLGNSAARKDVLKSVPVPPDLIAVDWYLFYHWMDDVDGVFLWEGPVFYRQHDSNTAGAKKITAAQLQRIVDVKVKHYDALLPAFPQFGTELQRLRNICLRLAKDTSFADDAVRTLNHKRINYFWWEETQYIHE